MLDGEEDELYYENVDNNNKLNKPNIFVATQILPCNNEHNYSE